ncbi:hypothetical protein ACFWVM_33640 [Nocardia fluminea]|uniref:hypothetical protein n=1 Tax=Nocardia fluminea TaxID=134984 RepID=UPI00365CE9B4
MWGEFAALGVDLDRGQDAREHGGRSVVVDARPRPITLLLPISDVITPVSEEEGERLRALAREIEIH